MHLTRLSSFLILLISFVSASLVKAQSKSSSVLATTLYLEVFQADSTAFAALNAHNVGQLMTYFTNDVEFYNDGGSLTTYAQTSTNFGTMFKGAPDIRRELVKSSLEVYPLKDYGAIAIGVHRFCHKEKGQDECGTFKFTTIWQKMCISAKGSASIWGSRPIPKQHP